METHNLVTLGCKAACRHSRGPDYVSHIKSQRKLEEIMTKDLPEMEPLVILPSRKGKGNQGRVATPEDIEQQKRIQEDEAAGKSVQCSRSGIEALVCLQRLLPRLGGGGGGGQSARQGGQCLHHQCWPQTRRKWEIVGLFRHTSSRRRAHATWSPVRS